MEKLTRRCDSLSLSVREGKRVTLSKKQAVRLYVGWEVSYEEISKHGGGSANFSSIMAY